MSAPWADGTVHRLTEVEAFDAMIGFVRAFWERSGRPDDELGYFVSMVDRLDDGTLDPAHWSDWLEAIHGVRAGQESDSGLIEADRLVTKADGLLGRLRQAIAADLTGKTHALTWEDVRLLFQIIERARRSSAV